MVSNYNECSLDELLMLVRERDDGAFSELVLRYTPLVNKLSLGFVSAVYTYDEAFSDSCVALHRAAVSYDTEKKGITFGLYARICIYRRLCDSTARLTREDGLFDKEVDPECLSDGTNIESKLVGRERMQRYLSTAHSLLSDYEYRVFLLYIEGESTSSIAEKLGKTPKSVDNAKARIFKHLRSVSDLFSDI